MDRRAHQVSWFLETGSDSIYLLAFQTSVQLRRGHRGRKIPESSRLSSIVPRAYTIMPQIGMKYSISGDWNSQFGAWDKQHGSDTKKIIRHQNRPAFHRVRRCNRSMKHDPCIMTAWRWFEFCRVMCNKGHVPVTMLTMSVNSQVSSTSKLYRWRN